MNGTQLALTIALAFVAIGVVGLLVAEAIGAPTAVIAAAGLVALTGVGTLAVVVTRVPRPAETDTQQL
jgi:hypothetical protein